MKIISKLPHNSSCIILWLFFFLFHFSTTPAMHANNETDFQALIAFKRAIDTNRQGALNSWNESVHFCSWDGIFCSKRHQNRVVGINLRSRGLVGSISPHFGNLSFLKSITLQNNTFYGQIPEEVGRLRRLQRLEFSNNSFTGGIPRNLSKCTNIKHLDLSDNKLHGTIIPELSSLKKLEFLGLGLNQFSSSIPPTIGNLTNLQVLFLPKCGMQGEIPQSIAQLQSLINLNLAENNFTGTIPMGMFNISTLRALSVRSNKLQGTIPSGIGLTLPRLIFLSLADNHMNGAIPTSLSNSSFLETILLSINTFSEELVVDLGRISTLRHLNLFSNHLTGNANFITSSLTNCTLLQVLILDGNLFHGSLANSISNLSSHLYIFSIGDNQLDGPIPLGIGNLLNLTILNLQRNNLQGPIPFAIGKLNKLQELSLGGNRLTNEIPFSFGNLTLLNHLYLMENNLHGSVPPSLSNCSNLLGLAVNNNNLSGPIPGEIMSLSSLSVFLDLSYNSFIGSIPLQVGSLTNLEFMDLSHNRLLGSIPVSLSSCISLEQIFLQNNFLYGEIPDELTTLKGLEYMDLSQNNLSGAIPRFLGELDLVYLNLSFNRLEGEVPTSKVFRNESGVFLQGNGNLCGGIPSLSFHSCSIENPKKKHFSFVLKILIPLVSASAFCIILSTCLYKFVYKKAISQSTDSPIPCFEMEFLRLSYADLLKSTGGFSDDNLLGVGRFGSVYKGILGDEQIPVAVKVLNLNTRGASKSFLSECNALRGVRHRNLVKMVSICSSTDFQGNDFKALVYEFKANGDLDKLLHQNAEEETQKLTTMQRLNIVANIANALEYLHCGTGSIIVHGDLKPSNVLLDETMHATVGDFGLAKVVSGITSTHESSSIGIKGTIGYIPPEYGMNMKVSPEGDVYSFGILLLEVFTGKRPTNEMFQGSLSIRDFVKHALPSLVDDIVHPIIWGEYNLKGKIKNCIVSVLEIGLECSKEFPRESDGNKRCC